PMRSATDRVVAGVAGGLAEQLGVDAVVIRLALAVLAFAGGAGLMIYLLCWLFGTDDAGVTAKGAAEASDARSEPQQALAVVLVANDALAAARVARGAAFAVLVTVAGLALILGPWITRLVRQVSEERRDRIRSEERAEMAAHLHDSVLQTLAMIQRAASQQE